MKIKRILALTLAATMMLSAVGCSKEEDTNTIQEQAKTVQITHELGTVEVKLNPERLAVLDAAALDIVDKLELGSNVVGTPKTSVSYLQSYMQNDEVKILGTVKEVDMEALMSSQPDVIIIGGRLKEEYENLSKIAPVIYVAIDRSTPYMDNVEKNVNMIASMYEKEEMVSELLAGFSDRIEKLKESVDDKTAIISLVTSGSINTLGNDSRCSIIANEIGFTNLSSDIDSTHGDTASFELLVEKNPDYIFALDRDNAIGSEGSEATKSVVENELVMKTDAYKNGNIVYLTPEAWYLTEGGITATDMMLKDLENAIIK